MNRSLERMLTGVIDYAGLFPPAQLPMDESVRNYLSYRQGMQALLVDRFVCPSTNLQDLLPLLRGPEVPVAVLGTPGPWDESRESDAKQMNAFLEEAGEEADIKAYEVKVPDTENLEGYLRDLKGFSDVDVFVELPWGAPMKESLSLLAQSEYAFAKARTGGDLVPTGEQLAEFIHGCLSLDLPFKLTAGLHHLFRGPGYHGLINVIGGTALSLAEDLSQRELQRVLETAAEQWRFGPDSIACMGYEAGLDHIAAARDLFTSVGSCSVDEPLQELESFALVGGERK